MLQKKHRRADRGTKSSAELFPDRCANGGPDRGPNRGPTRGPDRGPNRGPNRGPDRDPNCGPDRSANRCSSGGAHFVTDTCAYGTDRGAERYAYCCAEC